MKTTLLIIAGVVIGVIGCGALFLIWLNKMLGNLSARRRARMNK